MPHPVAQPTTGSPAPQLHVAHRRWRGELLERHEGRTHGAYPSLPAGFWTSTETAPFRSAYTDVCLQTTLQPGGPRWPPAAVVKLDVVGAPRVLRVGTVYDLWEAYLACSAGPVYDGAGDAPLCLDALDLGDARPWVRHFAAGDAWTRLAAVYDAVHFADDDADEPDRILEEWGCESTCWWRPRDHLRVVEARRFAEDAAPLTRLHEPPRCAWF